MRAFSHASVKLMATTMKKATPVTTPWGKAAIVEEVTVKQRSGDQDFASLVQLLEGPKGERFVRFAYSTGDTARRGPVTLRAQDVARLLKALPSRPELAAMLRFGGV